MQLRYFLRSKRIDRSLDQTLYCYRGLKHRIDVLYIVLSPENCEPIIARRDWLTITDPQSSIVLKFIEIEYLAPHGNCVWLQFGGNVEQSPIFPAQRYLWILPRACGDGFNLSLFKDVSKISIVRE